MKDLGLSLSTGINSFAKGMELGERWKSRMDDDAWNAEVKNRQRADWQASDELRAKQAQAQQLQAYYEAMQSGIDVDPTPVLEAMKNAGQFGASVAQHFAEPEKMQNWLNAANQVFETGQGSPEALEALNWRLQDQVSRGVGDTLQKPVILGDSHVIPAGSKIVGKRISQVVPAARKDGSGKYVQNDDASLFFGLDVDVETPDGRRMTYPAPVTVGRGTGDDAQILAVPFDALLDMLEADKLVLSDIQRDPKFAGAIRAALASLGSPVPADKFQTVSVDEGDQRVTYQVDARGNRKEIARAPRWKPEGLSKTPTSWAEFERAKADGFPGGYVDFLDRKRGRGFSFTSPDGSVFEMGGAGGGKPPSGYRWKADGSALEPIPGGPEDPNTPKKPGAEVQRMNIAIEALDGGLQAYEELLDRFDVRSFDQLDPTQRAEAASLVADLRLQFKEAQALGALTGPDISVLDQLLSDPTSGKAMVYGNEGLLAQLQQARQSVARRKAATDKITGAAPADSGAPEKPRYREGQTATNPQTGERMAYRNGRWERL